MIGDCFNNTLTVAFTAHIQLQKLSIGLEDEVLCSKCEGTLGIKNGLLAFNPVEIDLFVDIFSRAINLFIQDRGSNLLLGLLYLVLKLLVVL